ncbi:MAG: hypothetical protein RLZZ529_196 [Bacteroidota bacterium]
MNVLEIIKEPTKMYMTNGSNPLLVTCSDLNEWVCKYDRFPTYLFNELIGSEFARIWNINTPEICKIIVDIKYIPFERYPKLTPNHFIKECFGSKLIEDSEDVNDALLSSFKDKKYRNRIVNKSDLLKIAFFDIWLCNDDRNFGNNNLLIKTDKYDDKHFYVIDHTTLFNSSHLERELAELTEDDSILNTDMARLLLGNLKKLTKIVDNLVDSFYICTSECENNIDNILAKTPQSWDIDIPKIKGRMTSELFSEEWKKKCEINFRTLVQKLIIN